MRNCRILLQIFPNAKRIVDVIFIHLIKQKLFSKYSPVEKCSFVLIDVLHRSSDWQIIWDMMDKECRDEITLVESDQLLDALENYLHKHRFVKRTVMINPHIFLFLDFVQNVN